MLDGFLEGFVRVHGVRLFYRTRGKPTKGTILLLHGGPGGNHFGLLPFADLVQFGYRVVWYDQSGCGRSARPRSSQHYTLAQLARETEGIRRALHLGRVHLIAHSFGVPIALEAALRFPRGFRSLTLGSGYSSAQQVFQDALRQFRLAPRRLRSVIEKAERKGGDLSTPRYERAKLELNRRFVRTSEGLPAVMYRGKVCPWEVSQMIAGFNPRLMPYFVGSAADLVLAPIGGSMAGWDATPKLGEIRVPTLVTVGRYDTIDPTLSREIHRGIPGSEFVLFENSGHVTMLDERDLYMDTVRRFLDRVGRTGLRDDLGTGMRGTPVHEGRHAPGKRGGTGPRSSKSG